MHAFLFLGLKETERHTRTSLEMQPLLTTTLHGPWTTQNPAEPVRHADASGCQVWIQKVFQAQNVNLELWKIPLLGAETSIKRWTVWSRHGLA